VKKLPILVALLAISTNILLAQELPRPSMAREDQKNPLPTDYNIKAGPVLFNFTGSLDGEFNDNIGLTNSGTKSDFLITPEVGIEAQWPVTQTNTLSLSTSLGYTKYLIHPQYDQSHLLVAPDSNVSFDIYTGNFKINIHDDFSYQQDPVQEAALSNVVNFDRFQNVAGVGVLWDLNKVILTLNYDHIDFISTDLQTVGGAYINDPGALSYSANQVSTSAEFLTSSTFIFGFEAAASQREYFQYQGDYDQLSAGPYIKVQITDHIKAQLSGGFDYISTPSNNVFAPIAATGVIGPGSGGGSDSSYYVNLTIDHNLNKYFLERLALGHELELDLVGQESDVTYINYSASWKVNDHLNLSFDVGYQDVDEESGLIGASSFNLFNAGAQANFPITKSLSGALVYQFNDKMAEDSNQSFQQNQVDLLLTYHF
jgi:hypothetical protein